MTHVTLACVQLAPVQFLQGQAYTDAGATAYDAIDGAISNVATAGLSSLDTMVVSHLLPLHHEPAACHVDNIRLLLLHTTVSAFVDCPCCL